MFDPNTTFPKFRFGGEIENVASTPVPCNEYTVGDPVALCVICQICCLPVLVMLVYTLHQLPGLPPEPIVTGNVFGENVYCVSDELMFVIT